MADFLEHDFDNPVHWRRRRRRPPPLEGEIILTPESEPRVHRVEIVHRYQPRRHNAPAPWLIMLLAAGVLMWLFPFGTIVALAIISILAMEHPAIAIAISATLALVVAIAVYERYHGRRV